MRLRVGAHSATGPQHPICKHCCQHVTTATCLARHATTHLAAPCCAGAAPLRALHRTQRTPSARPARPPAFACMMYVCVCVGRCDIPVPVDVSLPFGSAVVCYSVASAFCWSGRCFAFVIGFVFGCSCDLLLAHAQMPWLRSRGVLYSAHSVCEGRSAGSRSQMLAVCFQSSLHTTPHPFITHHIHITHNHPHHSHHHTRSCSRKFEMAFSLTVPRGCTLCLIKSTQIKPSYTKSYPHKYNFKDTRKDTHKDTHKSVAYRYTLSYTSLYTNKQIRLRHHSAVLRICKSGMVYSL